MWINWKIFWGLCFLNLLCVSQVFAKEYIIDQSHSSVSFAIKHLSVADTIGVFEEFSGQLFVEDNKITRLYGEVKIPSINTQNSARDEDVQSFFISKIATLESLGFHDDILLAKLTINNITQEIQLFASITGPIRNPSLDLTKQQGMQNPFALQEDIYNPLSNPLFADTSSTDCGCYASYGDNVIGVELSGKIDRFAFGIAKDTPKELLGQYVFIKIILEGSN